MKIARITRGSGESYAIVKGNRLIDRDEIVRQLRVDLPQIIEEFLFDGGLEIIKSIDIDINPEESLGSYRFLPPVKHPSKIICLGYNYLDHAKEQGKKPPEEPVIFMKPRTTLVGTDEKIVCPKFVTQLDYEGELAMVIGKECKNVGRERAMENVLGYMVFNDVSARDIQFRESQWTKGKSFDTFAPCGPWLTTSDEIADPHSLRIITKVNGEVRQDSSTKNMALKLDKIIASLSKVMTLEEGDIIATGTPSGVAAFMQNPKFLKHNDVVEIEIENLGSIRNTVDFVE